MENVPSIDVYVRLSETGASGHVNNTNYFVYMEEARSKFFEAAGFDFGKSKELNFIIARTECDFIAQAYVGQTLTVTTLITKIGTKSYTLAHEIKEAMTGLLIAEGSAVVVCFDFLEQKTVLIPEGLRTKLEENMLVATV